MCGRKVYRIKITVKPLYSLCLAKMMEKGRVEGMKGRNCEERDVGGTVRKDIW